MAAAHGPVSPELVVPAGAQLATFAAGCFWGTEHMFRQHFGDGKGLIDAKVGYTGGSVANPDYKQVCSHSTGHAEALQISFDPKIVTYETLVDFFFKMHDPTTADQQGPDVGPQYRSGIFTHSDEQNKIAHSVKDHLQETWYIKKITTKIEPIDTFWDAETYHQLYLDKNPTGYACPSHFLRTKPEKIVGKSDL
ncbi:peptide methionine sulfoxide reductase [Trichomonascus vanleenenianus]|uniref:peptide-methionine-S-sulfoxide reductase n=1 Tax=Trichomonascus vanleenenianus TaxID=2268995 RepID=UPI003ECBA8F4